MRGLAREVVPMDMEIMGVAVERRSRWLRKYFRVRKGRCRIVGGIGLEIVEIKGLIIFFILFYANVLYLEYTSLIYI